MLSNSGYCVLNALVDSLALAIAIAVALAGSLARRKNRIWAKKALDYLGGIDGFAWT
jgi:hypothetical protein